MGLRVWDLRFMRACVLSDSSRGYHLGIWVLAMCEDDKGMIFPMIQASTRALLTSLRPSAL